MPAPKGQKISPPTPTGAQGQCRSLAINRTPEAITDRDNHLTTTVHIEPGEQLHPLLTMARPKGLEPLIF
jgi:hypothetical protein